MSAISPLFLTPSFPQQCIATEPSLKLYTADYSSKETVREVSWFYISTLFSMQIEESGFDQKQVQFVSVLLLFIKHVKIIDRAIESL